MAEMIEKPGSKNDVSRRGFLEMAATLAATASVIVPDARTAEAAEAEASIPPWRAPPHPAAPSQSDCMQPPAWSPT